MVATIQRQVESGAGPGAGPTPYQGSGAQPSFGADSQALTRKLSEAALGLSSGKKNHAFLTPDSLLPSPCKGDAAAPEPSSLSGGRNGVHRPQARRQGSTSSGVKHQASPYDKQALVAALSWQHASLSDKNVEGSATSDEDHPRLVPRRGAGPELRSSGREIDEYLMRLLHAGSTDASQDIKFHHLTPPANGDAVATVDTSVAFPAGWNNTKPWFVGSGARNDSAQAQAPVQANPVKPMMPPPPFPAQPWQGSRLGPLPPVGPLAQCPMTAQQADKLAGKFLGDSSVLAAGSEGTVDTLTLPAASCPAATAQDPNQQDAPANSPLHQDMPPQQQQQQQEEQGTPNGTEQPEKRQKTESNRPAEKARGSDSQQQHAVRDAVQPRAPTVIKTEAPAEMAPGAQKPVQASDERIARAMVGRVGKLGMDVIRDTVMCQQALWTEQVEDLHRVVTRQNVLTRLIGLPKEERQQAQAVKKENTSGDAAADPRTVLVSHVGNGSGGSQPSTDQGSWPQVQSDTGRDASLPSGMLPSAQYAQHAQQAQSVRHPVNQAMAPGHNMALSHVGFPQAGQHAAAQQEAQHAAQAQHAQQARQQEQHAAQELVALSGQGSRDPVSRLGQGHFGQGGQDACQEAMGLNPSFRAGSGQLYGAPQTPTGLSPTFMAAQAGQFGRAGSGQLGRVASGQLGRASSGPFIDPATDPLMRATSGQLMQGLRAMSGQLSGQLGEPMGNLSRAGSAAAAFMDAQASGFQMQDGMAAQLQQRSRSYPPPPAMHPQGMGTNVAAQQQQPQQSAAEWYAEFLHHMSIQQPAPNMLQHPAIQQPPPNMLQHPAVWPWSYHYAQSQMAAQAMNAAAMSLQGDARMMWQNPGAQPPPFGLQQAMAAQAAHQQQLQQQQANFQGKCNMSNATPPDGASEDAASQESARESHEHPNKSPGAPADAPAGAAAIAKTDRADEATSSLSSPGNKKRPRDT